MTISPQPLTPAEMKALAPTLQAARLILANVSDASGVPVKAIMGRNRRQPVALARQMACYKMVQAGMSSVQVGDLMDLHPTTVLHACEAVTTRMTEALA